MAREPPALIARTPSEVSARARATRSGSLAGARASARTRPSGVEASRASAARIRSNSRALRAVTCMAHAPSEERTNDYNRWLMALATAAAPNPLVDVAARDARRATVQHREQRRHPAEAGAVTHARRHRDHRHPHQAADDARQRAFHPRDRDDHEI